MNIDTILQNLKNTIAGKEEYLTTLKTTELVETSERIHRATVVGMLEINISELKSILKDVEKCIQKEVERSWRDNPDRIGGQFTQDEMIYCETWK